MPRNKEELGKLTVVELKNALKELGQTVTGKKEELVDRLFAAEQESTTDGPAAEAPAASTEAAAPDAAPAAEAEEAAATTTDAPAAEAADPPADGKRPKILFNEEVLKTMPTKITVIKSVELAKAVKSDAEKIAERSERFKDPDVEKAKVRAERFGVFNADIEKDKAKKRAERFGTTNADLDEERKTKRAARFGIEDPVAKLSNRAQRFGIVAAPAGKATTAKATTAASTMTSSEFEAQKKARAARFGA